MFFINFLEDLFVKMGLLLFLSKVIFTVINFLIYVIELVKDEIYYVGDESDKFSLIDPWLSYPGSEDEKDIDDLFSNWTYSGHINSGQHKFDIDCQSLESFYEVLAYFTGRGWYNRINIINKSYKPIKKIILTLNGIRNQIKNEDWSWLSNPGLFRLSILVNKKDYKEFVSLFSNFPSNYKIIWRVYAKNRYEFRKTRIFAKYIIQ